MPPEDETIQHLWDDITGEKPLWKTFRKKSSMNALDENNFSVRIANGIDEIPCGQHHRFTLLVFGREKQEVVWHSSRSDIAQIDAKTGEMTAVGEGNARIWVADASGRVMDTLCIHVTPAMTQGEIDALYWDEYDHFMQEGMAYCGRWDTRRLPENVIVLVDPCHRHFWDDEKVQVRIPASVRAMTYDISMEDDWGLGRGEHVAVSVDGDNRNYYSLFGVLFSYAFKNLKNPESTTVETAFMCMADCKYRALLFYPPDRKNEVYYVPDGVERIAGRAFEKAKYLRKVVLPDTVKEIGPGAFDGCNRLEEIVIPESVVKIEDNDYVLAIDAAPEVVMLGIKAKITIVTPKGSAAEAYAIEHGIAYRNE